MQSKMQSLNWWMGVPVSQGDKLRTLRQIVFKPIDSGIRWKEGWAPKNWFFRIVVLEKTLQSPLDCKEVKPVDLKGNQPWIFIGRTDAEAEAPILWPPDVKNWLTWKDPDAGKDWRQEEKRATGWDGWTASPTWTWVRATSGRWWRTGKPGVLQSVGLQRVGHDLGTKQQQQLEEMAENKNKGHFCSSKCVKGSSLTARLLDSNI